MLSVNIYPFLTISSCFNIIPRFYYLLHLKFCISDFNSEINLVEENDSENCIPDIDFQPCKIPVSSSLPERQMRLKVKDSIGGVSLQDTSQGEKTSQRGSPEVQEISEAIDSCQPFQEQIENG